MRFQIIHFVRNEESIVTFCGCEPLIEHVHNYSNITSHEELEELEGTVIKFKHSLNMHSFCNPALGK